MTGFGNNLRIYDITISNYVKINCRIVNNIVVETFVEDILTQLLPKSYYAILYDIRDQEEIVIYIKNGKDFDINNAIRRMKLLNILKKLKSCLDLQEVYTMDAYHMSLDERFIKNWIKS